jgi:hypothetical protein
VRGPWTFVVVAALVIFAGCTSDKVKTPEIGAADAYLAIVTWELGELPPPGTDASLPVVYIAPEDGTTIDAGAQANVLRATVDVAKVRFTDVRDDATDKGVDGAPVKDGGVLLIVGKIDAKGTSRLELPITVYRTETDQQDTVLTLVATTAGVTVTSAAPQPSG